MVVVASQILGLKVVQSDMLDVVAQTNSALLAAIQEAHEEAVQKAKVCFNSIAVWAGSARQKCEKHLHIFFKKEFEVIASIIAKKELHGDHDCMKSLEEVHERNKVLSFYSKFS